MKISADMGHGYAKFYDGQKIVSFPAVVGETQVDLMGANNRMEIETQEGHWYIGETALSQSFNQIDGRSDKWAFSAEYRALLLFGITRFVGAQTKQVLIDLVAGLPIKDYKRNKTEVLTLLKKSFFIQQPKRRNLTVEIRNVQLLPQGFTPARDHIAKDRNVATLDLGSRTVSYATFEGGDLIDSQTNSEERGATTVLLDIARAIELQTTRELSTTEVVEAIKTKQVRASNQVYDISEILKDRLGFYQKSILSLMQRVWGDASKLDNIIVFGGGAHLVGEEILKTYPHQAVVLKQPQFATVISQFEYRGR